MTTDRGHKTKTAKSTTNPNPVLKFRLSKNMLADIDYVISTVPQLDGFKRSKFVRAAIRYVLDSLREEGFQRDRAAGRKPTRH